jgi:hypothetical protein
MSSRHPTQAAASHLAPGTGPGTGRNVPGGVSEGTTTAQPAPRRVNMSTAGGRSPTGVAGWLLIAFAGLVLANTAVLSLTAGATGTDWSFAVLLAMVAGASAHSLWQGARWARWIALALAFVGLFFILPVTGTILLGGPTDPVGTGWDVVFFPLSTAVLLALLAALWAARRSSS